MESVTTISTDYLNRFLINKLNNTKYEDFSSFKLYLLGVGLLGAMSDIPAQVLLSESSIFVDYKGALTEQYVLQQIKPILSSIFYWSADNSSGEIDFLVQNEEEIVPIEVKAEENLQAKSLKSFIGKNPQLHGLRTSMSSYREQDWLTNVPLYGIGSCWNK